MGKDLDLLVHAADVDNFVNSQRIFESLLLADCLQKFAIKYHDELGGRSKIYVTPERGRESDGV